MEAVKERPPHRSDSKIIKGQDTTKEKLKEIPSSSKNLNKETSPHSEHGESLPELESSKGLIQDEQPALNQLEFKPSSLSTESAESHIPPSNFVPPPLISQQIQPRINHFLIYPLCINIHTGNWEKMRLFYEEVLELNLFSHPDQNNLTFLGQNIIINLFKNSQREAASRKNPIELIFYTDLSLLRLKRKISTRSIQMIEGTIGSENTPIFYCFDPDGNRITFISNQPKENV